LAIVQGAPEWFAVAAKATPGVAATARGPGLDPTDEVIAGL
jgi:hypothetical protein